MILPGQTKKAILVPSQLKNNGALAGNTYVDTLGYDHIEVIIAPNGVDAAIGSTNASTPLKLEECDTTGGQYTDVAGAAMAAVVGAADATPSSICVSLKRSHKRYMRLNAPTAASGTTGANFTAIAILSRAQQPPMAAAEAGCKEWINA